MPRRLVRAMLLVLPLVAGGTSGVSAVVAATGGVMAPRADDEVLTPIRKITLYRSGVGYFERTGEVKGDAQVQLRFPTHQINDILKSLVLLDLGGGRVEAVSYGSKEPLARRLASFGVDISANPSIPNLLNQLRGAPIRITAGGEVLTGSIIGIEERPVQLTKDAPAFMAPYVNVLSGGAIRSVAVASVTSYELLDKELAGELEKALAALAEYRADRTKTVDIKFGAGGAGNTAAARRVVVGYIHEMPVWKTSYRLVLPDETAKVEPGKSRTVDLQGWAIVENNTDQDWEGVTLSLVSGRPVSFQIDLYEPLFVYRPLVPVPTVPGVAPRAYQGGQEDWYALAEGKPAGAPEPTSGTTLRYAETPQIDLKSLLDRSSAGGAGGGQSPFQNDQDKAYEGVSAEDLADYAAAAQAAAGEVGEVFQYELEAPVTIERQKSAMLPIMRAAVSGRRVSIFNMGDGSEHPMRGVEITNDAGLQLLPGPIAVFDGAQGKSAYAGDAQVGHVSAGEKRLLAYAVDLEVDALTEAATDSQVTRIRIVSGVFEQTSKVQQRVSYAFKNKDAARTRTVLVEHPRLHGYELVAPAKALETTQAFYRFELALEPGASGALAVTQEQTVSHRMGVADGYGLETLLEYQRNGKVSAAVLAAFREVQARRAVIGEAERQGATLDRRIEEIAKDQSRIRENIGQIDRNSQLYTRYMTKLSEQETELEGLTSERKEVGKRIESLRKELEAFVGALNVE